MTGDHPKLVDGSASAPSDKRSDAPPIESRVAAGGALVIAVVTLVVLDRVHGPKSALRVGLGASRHTRHLGIVDRRYQPPVPVVGRGLGPPPRNARRSPAWWRSDGAPSRSAAVIVGIAASSALGALALRWEIRHALARRWHDVQPARHGVVLMNPRSGGGKVAKLHLADEAPRNGAASSPCCSTTATICGARGSCGGSWRGDALGMAGGDGSQAMVAAVAAAHGLPFVCVPAGTRNHLALDLGIDRDKPVRRAWTRSGGPTKPPSTWQR